MMIVLWVALAIAGGCVASFVMPGPRAGGIIPAVVIGLVGAVGGGIAGLFITQGDWTLFNLHSLLTSAIGTLVLLFAFRALALRYEISRN